MKRQRQKAIQKAVKDGKVKSQSELVRLLARQGFDVSQTTVSRDLRELGLARGRDPRGTLRYGEVQRKGGGSPDDAALRRTAPMALLTTEPTGNLVVVKTSPGNAQGLAWAIDAAELKGVAGTVAGDDTILVVCSENMDSNKTSKRLMQYALDKR